MLNKYQDLVVQKDSERMHAELEVARLRLQRLRRHRLWLELQTGLRLGYRQSGDKPLTREASALPSVPTL
ncbi:MAG: hypothetical protein OYH77_06730 [Pseudomonadota bacterium]|nr:hypothetical protein [Pseudomonadota bacterium]